MLLLNFRCYLHDNPVLKTFSKLRFQCVKLRIRVMAAGDKGVTDRKPNVAMPTTPSRTGAELSLKEIGIMKGLIILIVDIEPAFDIECRKRIGIVNMRKPYILFHKQGRLRTI